MRSPTPRAAAHPWTDLASFAAALAERGNDLTDAAIALRPVDRRGAGVPAQERRRAHAAMSGSGATCFALYESVELAKRAAARLPTSWWHHAGKLVG